MDFGSSPGPLTQGNKRNSGCGPLWETVQNNTIELFTLEPEVNRFGECGLAQAELLMQAIEETPDITLAEPRARLIAERGETFALSTIHDFYRRHGITFKKRRRTPANRRAPT